MRKMIDKRLLKVAAVGAGYLVALVPLYLIVGYANLWFGWHVSFATASLALLTVAIVIAGRIYSRSN